MAKSSAKPAKQDIMPAGKKRATSYDVAQLAGVSQSAVSRCFKSGASVSAKMRARVLKAAKELGYQPNAIARGLITRRSNIVAVIMAEFTHLNYPEVLSHLNRRLADRGIHILLFTLGRESDVDTVLDQVWQYQVDGVIAAARFTPEQIDACEQRDIPLIFYNRVYEDSTVSAVCCDHAEGERQLVGGLLKNGRRSFVVVSGPPDSAVSMARTGGAVDRLKEAGVSYHVVTGDYTYDSGCQAVHQVMSEDRGVPDAFVCANDVMAIGCIDTLRNDYNLQVPKSVAVVGFDGVGAADWLSYDLTTIVQPVERMVGASISMLLERIETPDIPAEKRLFAGQLRQGASAKLA
ncbi:MAG: LacI family DNA-binding transcriptional regulator [Pseudomonadota bacterium]